MHEEGRNTPKRLNFGKLHHKVSLMSFLSNWILMRYFGWTKLWFSLERKHSGRRRQQLSFWNIIWMFDVEWQRSKDDGHRVKTIRPTFATLLLRIKFNSHIYDNQKSWIEMNWIVTKKTPVWIGLTFKSNSQIWK